MPGTQKGYRYYDVPLSFEMQDFIQDVMVEYGMPLKDYKYVLALIQRESEFEPDASNINGDGSFDYGYMQINSGNFSWMKESVGVEDCIDPKNNLRCGIYFLQSILSAYDDEIEYAVIGYRRGYSMGLQYKQLGVLDDYATYILDFADSLREIPPCVDQNT